MEEMGIFYEHCLEALYPPGVCGTFCNQHTYDCYLAEVHEACCDDDNCPAGHDIPDSCPVGCALVFPEFLETCRDYIQTETSLDETAYESFEVSCFQQDGLELVEYAMMLQQSGCDIDLTGSGSDSDAQHQQGHRLLLQKLRRLQEAAAPLGQLGQRLGAGIPTCR